MTSGDEVSHGLDAELPRLVGAAAIGGARAEFAVTALFAGLLDSPYADIITAGQPISTLIKNCKAIVNVHLDLNDQQRQTVNDLLGEIDKLSTRRFRLDQRADQRKMPAMWRPAR